MQTKKQRQLILKEICQGTNFKNRLNPSKNDDELSWLKGYKQALIDSKQKSIKDTKKRKIKIQNLVKKELLLKDITKEFNRHNFPNRITPNNKWSQNTQKKF